jgi:hypothetical protein
MAYNIEVVIFLKNTNITIILFPKLTNIIGNKYMFTMLVKTFATIWQLILSGDIALNPGPVKYPCFIFINIKIRV